MSAISFKKLPFLVVAILLGSQITSQDQVAQKKFSEENKSKMLRLRDADYLIKMDSEKFKNYVKTKNKRYSVVAMFTALKPNYKCTMCPDAKNEYDTLVSSYRTAYPDSEDIFFVMVDIYNSQEAFQLMNLKHVPALYYFPGTRKRKKIDTFDARRLGYKSVGMAGWLSEVARKKIKIIVPPDFTPLIYAAAFLFPFFILALWKPDIVTQILSNKTMWGLIVMTIVMIMTSGQMWNHIRKPPEANRDHNGNLQYIHGSRSGQFIFETYIVLGINAAISVGFILMNEVHSLKNKTFRKGIGFVGLTMVVVFFALLLHVFRMKNRSYPYSFIFQ